jgi:hypothetical protein
MAGPLRVLLAGPTAATIEAEEDVDGAPWGVLHAGPAVATTEVEEDVNGGALGGATGVSSSGHHRRRRRRWRAPGGAADRFGSGHVVLPMFVGADFFNVRSPGCRNPRASNHFSRETSMSGPLGGDASAQGRLPPCNARHRWRYHGPLQGSRSICCLNSHWFLQEKIKRVVTVPLGFLSRAPSHCYI